MVFTGGIYLATYRLSKKEKVLLELIAKSLFNKKISESLKDVDFDSIYKESCLQAVAVIAFDGMLKAGISDEDKEKYKSISQTSLVRNIQIQNAHGVLHNLLTENNIPYCILKGCASAYYYPKSEFRSMGDIDFIVPPEYFDKAEEVLLENGLKKIEIDCELHTVFVKGSFRYELHRSIKGIPDGDKQEIIEKYISQIVKTSVDADCKGMIFEKPEHFYHGLILLLHTYEHMLSEGIGLRHLCDWAVFVNSFSSEEFKSIFEEKLKNVGLWKFARILSATSVDFLGMPYKEWIGEINSEITYSLIEDIFIGGNFGRKSKTRTDEGMMISKGKEQHYIYSFVKSINKIVIHKWPVADKIKILILFGWLFFGGRYCLRMIFGKRRKLISKENINNAARRQNLYSKFKLFETE